MVVSSFPREYASQKSQAATHNARVYYFFSHNLSQRVCRKIGLSISNLDLKILAHWRLAGGPRPLSGAAAFSVDPRLLEPTEGELRARTRHLSIDHRSESTHGRTWRARERHRAAQEQTRRCGQVGCGFEWFCRCLARRSGMRATRLWPGRLAPPAPRPVPARLPRPPQPGQPLQPGPDPPPVRPRPRRALRPPNPARVA